MNHLLIKKIVQISSLYVLPVVLAVISFSLPDRWWFGKVGNFALLLLAGNVFLKPVSVLFPHPFIHWFTRFRREIGVASFWSYVFHSMGMLYIYGINPADIYSDTSSFLFFGGTAGIGMWLLGATSNDIAVRLLKRNWKRLHRLVYIVFLLALYHSSLVKGEMLQFYFFGSVFLILKVLEFRKRPLVW